MGKNERATFAVTTDDGRGDDAAQPRRFEYELSLDDWTEEVDVSEEHDGSLVKRIIRDGDGTTTPVDVGRVLIRYLNYSCRFSVVFSAPAGGGAPNGGYIRECPSLTSCMYD